MSDEFPRATLTFLDEIEFYEPDDTAQIWARVSNDGWIGNGDAMGTFALLYADGTMDQVYLPVNVNDGPVTNGAIVWFGASHVTKGVPGKAQISLIDLSGADCDGQDTWEVEVWPIRSPFDE